MTQRALEAMTHWCLCLDAWKVGMETHMKNMYLSSDEYLYICIFHCIFYLSTFYLFYFIPDFYLFILNYTLKSISFLVCNVFKTPFVE